MSKIMGKFSVSISWALLSKTYDFLCRVRLYALIVALVFVLGWCPSGWARNP